MSTATISEAKLRANRLNATQSTGPRTAAGKQASARNATTHGLYCRDLLLPGEDPAVFAAFRDNLLLRLDPRDFLELAIADQIVSCLWRLRRLQAAQHLYQLSLQEKLAHAAALSDPAQADLDWDTLDEAQQEELLDPARQKLSPLAAGLSLIWALQDEQRTWERLEQHEQRLQNQLHRHLRTLQNLRKHLPAPEAARIVPSDAPNPFIPPLPDVLTPDPTPANDENQPNPPPSDPSSAIPNPRSEICGNEPTAAPVCSPGSQAAPPRDSTALPNPKSQIQNPKWENEPTVPATDDGPLTTDNDDIEPTSALRTPIGQPPPPSLQ